MQDWPEGSDPVVVGKRLAEEFQGQNNADRRHYKLACGWYGALSLSAKLGEDALLAQLIADYDVNFYQREFDNLTGGLEPEHPQGHVDQNVFGIVPLEISLHDSDPVYLAQGLALADQQVEFIDIHTRYAVNDMFMITALMMQAYRASPEGEGDHCLDLAASTMVDYLATLQQADGVFHHHQDLAIRWGRGNGWFASGMAEIMRDLPTGHLDYTAIVAGCTAMMSGLVGYQIPQGEEGAGLWKQVLDNTSSASWAETSGSAMFTYAMVAGIKSGALACDEYGPVARNAWLGLVGYLNSQNQLTEISDWMWKGEGDNATPGAATAEDSYLGRTRISVNWEKSPPLQGRAAGHLYQLPLLPSRI